jgi:L-lactate utilization protein LutC
MSAAREEILARVRSAIAPTISPTAATPAAARVIPREYRATTDDGMQTFLERLAHYDARAVTCALAIAQTGTIVLDGGAGMGRRALTLLPDYHLCIVRADQIAGSVPEALALLDPTRPLTFVSGPSATVDIEMVRVRGVHGPRTLDVILVAAAHE